MSEVAKKIFISYSHADAALLDRLHKHLAQLQREGSISEWYDRQIPAGGRFDDIISSSLEDADIFIAALSPDFLSSNYCYDVELKTALEREKSGALIIVPVILEPCDWRASPLGKFKAVPTDGKAISEFTNQNAAFLNVVSELRKITAGSEARVNRSQPDTTASGASRYKIKKSFDAIDQRDFVDDAFSKIKLYFDSSVTEINSVPEIEASLKDQGPDSFSCTVINRGFNRKFETITVRKRMGHFGEISIVYGENPAINSSNGGFSVIVDDYQMYLDGSFFSFGSSQRDKLTPLEAAKMLWDTLLERVGIDYA